MLCSFEHGQTFVKRCCLNSCIGRAFDSFVYAGTLLVHSMVDRRSIANVPTFVECSIYATVKKILLKVRGLEAAKFFTSESNRSSSSSGRTSGSSHSRHQIWALAPRKRGAYSIFVYECCSFVQVLAMQHPQHFDRAQSPWATNDPANGLALEISSSDVLRITLSQVHKHFKRSFGPLSLQFSASQHSSNAAKC